jgi:hypothetical protein
MDGCRNFGDWLHLTGAVDHERPLGAKALNDGRLAGTDRVIDSILCLGTIGLLLLQARIRDI